MQEIEPFSINVSTEALQDLQKRLELARFPTNLDLPAGDEWSYGVPDKVMQELVEYWKTKFDWKRIEASINDHLPQFTTLLDAGNNHGSMRIHFAHKRSSNPNAIPLIFVHGWPGNFLEVSKMIDSLTEPTDPKHPAFHVVAPSLPGFCFSETSKKSGVSLSLTALMFNTLMKRLGYTKYIAQGGDWGSMVVRALAIGHPTNCRGVHTNMLTTAPPSPLKNPIIIGKLLIAYLASLVGLELGYTKDDLEGLKRTMSHMDEGAGYMKIQETFPQTLSFGLTDSPVGLLAWIYEKLWRWTDNYAWTNDEILTWVMLYWIGGPSGTVRFYKEARSPHMKTDERTYMAKTWSDVPLGVSGFVKEVIKLPCDWGAMIQPLVFTRTHKKGGHFAAWEQPDLLVGDIRDFVSIVSRSEMF